MKYINNHMLKNVKPIQWVQVLVKHTGPCEPFLRGFLLSHTCSCFIVKVIQVLLFKLNVPFLPWIATMKAVVPIILMVGVLTLLSSHFASSAATFPLIQKFSNFTLARMISCPAQQQNSHCFTFTWLKAVNCKRTWVWNLKPINETFSKIIHQRFQKWIKSFGYFIWNCSTGHKTHNINFFHMARSSLHILAIETSNEPQLLKLVLKGCHPSQWPIKAKFKGDPCAVLISNGNVSKHSGQSTNDIPLSSFAQLDGTSDETTALQLMHLVGRVQV